MKPTFSHRSSLKQSNKPFKSRHASKGSIKVKAKGMIFDKNKLKCLKGKVEKSSHSSGKQIIQHKFNRKNSAKIEQQKKRLEIANAARLFTGSKCLPKVIVSFKMFYMIHFIQKAVIPLCPDVNAFECTQKIFESVDGGLLNEQESSFLLSLDRFKQKIQFIPTTRHVLKILDALKVSDMVIFLVSSELEVDEFGEMCMSLIKTQGVPSVLGFAQVT